MFNWVLLLDCRKPLDESSLLVPSSSLCDWQQRTLALISLHSIRKLQAWCYQRKRPRGWVQGLNTKIRWIMSGVSKQITSTKPPTLAMARNRIGLISRWSILNLLHLDFPQKSRSRYSNTLRYHFQDVANLILVAHRVYEWLIPAFKVVIMTRQIKFPLRGYRLATFEWYGVHVRHLCVARSHDDPSFPNSAVSAGVDQYIGLCPNLVDLFLGWHIHAPTIRLVGSLPVLRLTTPATRLLYILSYVYEFIGTNPETIAFPNLTHLRLTYALPSQVYVAALGRHFPSLTHLAVEVSSDLSNDLAKLILQWCPKLNLVVVWRDGGVLGVDTGMEELEAGYGPWDERVVWLHGSLWEDWEASARGLGLDIWEVGQSVLERRRLRT
ncbi:hypothetical protein BDN72DRAFT_900453 [Pluteus cervinus]|uniref:Uncharacterized protein n=1 Tax=Pluteus cervinus TaxID=181527 RepID=A0ACD3AJB2_9AGAR|nr:hypothetical protein BDN72DRAFT_900453 [Pluteus cervinus]